MVVQPLVDALTHRKNQKHPMKSGSPEGAPEIEIPAKDGVSALSASTVAAEGTGIRALRTVVIGTVAVLFLYSLHLAINRIIQVDEAQNLFMARVIGSGETDRYFVNPAIFLIGPLAWIAESAASAREAFIPGRLIFAGIFWLNIFLLVRCTGASLRTAEGLLAALAAATLVPLWDYGFEIRHDNLLLAGLLSIWLFGRYRGEATSSYFAIGALSAVLQFVAFKAFVYTVPISMYLLVSRGAAEPKALSRALAAWLAGVALAGAICLSVYASHGLLAQFFGNTVGLSQGPQSSARFYPFSTLSRFLLQTPLVVAVAAAALLVSIMAAVNMPRAILKQDGLMPEAFLLCVALGALFVNPTPFPYNLINVVPFAFLLAHRFIRQVVTGWPARQSVLALAVSIFAFTHFVPFVYATLRHANWNNWRQMRLAQAAEAMTDPEDDPVYDATGLVLTRHSIDRSWYLHSLNMQQLRDGKQRSVADMLRRNPAPVLIPNYRFDWLPESDWQYIHANYISLADDFRVLGTQVPPGGGSFAALRAGRYQLLPATGTWKQPAPQLALDDQELSTDIVTLAAGTHTIRTPSDVPVLVVWLGPQLDRLPSLGQGNHRTLFANWY